MGRRQPRVQTEGKLYCVIKKNNEDGSASLALLRNEKDLRVIKSQVRDLIKENKNEGNFSFSILDGDGRWYNAENTRELTKKASSKTKQEV